MPQSIATILIENSRGTVYKDQNRSVKNKSRKILATSKPHPIFKECFSTQELIIAIRDLKSGKAPGRDGIHPKFLHNLGSRALQWLASVYFDIFQSGQVPKTWKEADVIAIQKLGKPEDDPKSYRLISLLFVMSKLMERIILKRIGPTVEKAIPLFQAVFRPNISCCDQVLAITSYLEKCYNINTKTGPAFIDLSAAYDTVWKHGLLLKLARIIPCQFLLRYLGNSLGNRNFRVLLGDRDIKSRVLNNGLPQGSVLAPTLFNIYTHDPPSTTSKKFVYADDICIATQCKDIDIIEKILEEDLNVLENYFKMWRLMPNPLKTAVSLFHLNNRAAN